MRMIRGNSVSGITPYLIIVILDWSLLLTLRSVLLLARLKIKTSRAIEVYSMCFRAAHIPTTKDSVSITMNNKCQSVVPISRAIGR